MKLEYPCFGERCGVCQYAPGKNRTGCQDHRIKNQDWTLQKRFLQIQTEAKRIVFKAIREGGEIVGFKDTGKRLPYKVAQRRVGNYMAKVVRKVVQVPEIRELAE